MGEFSMPESIIEDILKSDSDSDITMKDMLLCIKEEIEGGNNLVLESDNGDSRFLSTEEQEKLNSLLSGI
jgi:hypothetical protein